MPKPTESEPKCPGGGQVVSDTRHGADGYYYVCSYCPAVYAEDELANEDEIPEHVADWG